MDEILRDPRSAIRRILDEMYPPDKYTAEDRAQALLFHARCSIAAEKEEVRRSGDRLGIPANVTEAMLHGDVRALRAALADAGHGWPMLASLIGARFCLDTTFEVMHVLRRVWEEVTTPDEQRPLRHISPEELSRRGYTLRTGSGSAGQRPATAPSPDADPRRVTSRDELVHALRELRSRMGALSLRSMQAVSDAGLTADLDPMKHESRSYNTLGNVLKHKASLSVVNVLAFVRGCGVRDPAELRAWEEACVRVGGSPPGP